jgi:leucyl-tRNA synthetase
LIENKSIIEKEEWPNVEAICLSEDEITYVIQINGKTRANIKAPSESEEDDIARMAKKDQSSIKYLEGKKITKQVFVKGKLINFVVE